MYDAGRVYLGLAIFIGIFAFGFYYSLGTAAPQPKPSIDTPEINKMLKKQCVEDTEFMRTTHMKLLVEWRDEALRNGNRTYVNSRGEKIKISLQNTCMKCHSNKKDFCDRCHTYAMTAPYCWDCHIDPNGGKL